MRWIRSIVLPVLGLSIKTEALKALLIHRNPSRHTCTVKSVPRSLHHKYASSPSNNYHEKVDGIQPIIPILYESDRILIIDKPHGIAHHDDENGNPGIISLVRQQRKQRIWGVHRLDRVTSGILILAKDVDMASLLSNAFAEGKIQKVYVGISAKRKPKKKQGWVQGSMTRSRDKSWKLNRTQKERKKFAKTRFFTAKLFDGKESRYTCILFRPYTGRTHQLRVAAKSMGIALLGDPIYKDGKDSFGMEPSRTYLHATGICIPSMDGETPCIDLWHPPPFDDLLGGESALESVLGKLMIKYCDVQGIIDSMKKS